MEAAAIAIAGLLIVIILVRILAIIAKGLRDNSAQLGTAIAEIQKANARPMVDMEKFLNPPPPPCHHKWRTVDKQVIDGTYESKLVHIMECEECGAIDKTIESVKKELQRSECRHSWETQRTKEIESAYEQIAENSKKASEMCADPQPWMFRKCYLVTRICCRCGEINTVLAANYELEDVKDTDAN